MNKQERESILLRILTDTNYHADKVHKFIDEAYRITGDVSAVRKAGNQLKESSINEVLNKLLTN